MMYSTRRELIDAIAKFKNYEDDFASVIATALNQR